MNPFRRLLLLLTALVLWINITLARQHSEDNPRIKLLKASVEPLLKLPLHEMVKEVPSASGIHYIGCPNCRGGAQDMGVLIWEYGMADQVKCRFCHMVFPNEKFPNNREKVITAPSGAVQVYKYYEDQKGKTHYYEAHAWYERWKWVQTLATDFAELWVLTKNPTYADRAAAILGRFAQVFPDYAVRFDYPGRPVQFFPANQKWPYKGLQPYRGAKWNWWGYSDIPIAMAEVYQKLQEGYDWKRMDKLIGPHTDQRIIKDLLTLGYEHVAANTEIYTNMSPGMYENMIRLGNILNNGQMRSDGLKRFREFMKTGFFEDGWWKEGTVSYHNQTVGALNKVINSAGLHPDSFLYLKKALEVSRNAILPNGRKIPINDTWPYDKIPGKGTEKTVSRLWPALGNAALGTGEGTNQFMLNVNWSGNYGHSHYDNGSIILYAQGQELLSDLGYTHSKYRGWTIQTPSHNTVVIDQIGQDVGTPEQPVTGRLLYYDDSDPHVKVVDVDVSPAYRSAKIYRRRIVTIHAASGQDYVLDRFDVEGGKIHDWFLHGNAEQEGTLEISTPIAKSIHTLVPDWGGNHMPNTQYDVDLSGKRFHPYAYLRDIYTGNTDGAWTSIWRYDQSGLRTHHLPAKDTEIFRFRAPAVRPAGEDDNKLDDYMRSGILRRQKGGSSTFIALHEPFSKQTWIHQVYQEGPKIVVQYHLKGKLVTDRISLNDDGSVEAISTAGWSYTTKRR